MVVCLSVINKLAHNLIEGTQMHLPLIKRIQFLRIIIE
ncbi:MAG: hypothetical protein ACJAUD_000598 [Crocinitomicaceae bacterium]|jgi:hypothetical protein